MLNRRLNFSIRPVLFLSCPSLRPRVLLKFQPHLRTQIGTIAVHRADAVRGKLFVALLSMSGNTDGADEFTIVIANHHATAFGQRGSDSRFRRGALVLYGGLIAGSIAVEAVFVGTRTLTEDDLVLIFQRVLRFSEKRRAILPMIPGSSLNTSTSSKPGRRRDQQIGIRLRCLFQNSRHLLLPTFAE